MNINIKTVNIVVSAALASGPQSPPALGQPRPAGGQQKARTKNINQKPNTVFNENGKKKNVEAKKKENGGQPGQPK